MASQPTSISVLSSPLTLPCGLVLPNRLVKCPMQEVQSDGPFYDPPIDKFRNLYGLWGESSYGLIITGQVQVDIRFLSIAGDVVCHDKSLESPHFETWKEWARVSQQHGTPTIVQLAHPGRMSPRGAGNRLSSEPPLCASAVPVALGDTWYDKMAVGQLLGSPRAMTLEEIDQVVEAFVHGAKVSMEAGFKGVQLHGAHGFLLSQFLSTHTNRRTDDYGGSPANRLRLLQRIVKATREACPAPFCLSVKLNSGDYLVEGGLTQDEALDQVQWLVECGMVDFVEISGGIAEQKTSGLHNSFGSKSLEKAPVRKESTRIREAYFTEFAERIRQMETKVPIQLSGGFRSRVGMANAIETGACDLIGLGRTAILQPSLPSLILLNPEVPDEQALALPHIVKGQWLANIIPVKVVGSGLAIQFFYHNMTRLGRGLGSDPDASIPFILFQGIKEAFTGGMSSIVGKLMSILAYKADGASLKKTL